MVWPGRLSLEINTSLTSPIAGWHGAVPQDWVPIISRDSREPVERQPPYSDAYLAGQPSKRRKLDNESKPRGEVGQVIEECLEVSSGKNRPKN